MGPLGVLAALAGSAFAQGGPEVHGVYMPRSDVGPISTVPVDTNGMSAGVMAWGISTPTPPITLIEDRWVLANLLAFEHTSLGFEGGDLLGIPDGHKDLFRIQWALVSAWTPSDKLSVILLAQPGLYSDFAAGISGADFGFVGMALGAWKFGEGFSAGLGVGYVQLFGRPTVTPFVSVDAEVGRLSVDALVPREAAIWLRLADPLRLGFRGSLDGGFYHVQPADPTLGDVFQEYSVLMVGPALELTAKEKLRLTLSGGRALRRQLEVYEDRDTVLVDFALEPGWAGGAELGILL